MLFRETSTQIQSLGNNPYNSTYITVLHSMHIVLDPTGTYECELH